MMPYSWLEPYAGKLASTVLKGKGGGDPAGLPGTSFVLRGEKNPPKDKTAPESPDYT